MAHGHDEKACVVSVEPHLGIIHEVMMNTALMGTNRTLWLAGRTGCIYDDPYILGVNLYNRLL